MPFNFSSMENLYFWVPNFKHELSLISTVSSQVFQHVFLYTLKNILTEWYRFCDVYFSTKFDDCCIILFTIR